MTISTRSVTREDELTERIRLLEYQLEYQRREMQHLVHEREKNIYSAAWLIFQPLRRFETKLVDTLTATLKPFRAKKRPAVDSSTAVSVAPPEAPPQFLPPQPARRLLVDVTGTVNWDAGTGIQRVVKRVTQELYRTDDLPISAQAVRCANGSLYTCNKFVASLTGVSASDEDREISIEPGDRLLMLSDTWNAFNDYLPVFEKIRAKGGEVISCVFDLIPELYPYSCHELTVPLYDAWLRQAVLESDGFIAISRTVAEELAQFIEERGLAHRAGLKIGWFHCGSDIADGPVDRARDQVRAAVSGSAPVFLCVGTMEPRKGQRTALQAFEELWADGLDARLVFVGRRGWLDEAVVCEITSHPEYGRRLHWFGDADDNDLSFLYDRAAALAYPSYAEGFGLPIVEAARRNRPVLCSDIPVFREVGRDGAAYFRVNDPHALAECVRGFLAGSVPTDPKKVLRSSWNDAARRIVDVIARDEWSERLP